MFFRERSIEWLLKSVLEEAVEQTIRLNNPDPNTNITQFMDDFAKYFKLVANEP